MENVKIYLHPMLLYNFIMKKTAADDNDPTEFKESDSCSRRWDLSVVKVSTGLGFIAHHIIAYWDL